jgi:hypothetical protein
MKDPIRLRDDPRASELCRELIVEGMTPPHGYEYDVTTGLERFEGSMRAEAAHTTGRMRRVPRTSLGKLTLRVPVYGLISGFAAVAFGGSAVWIHHQHATSVRLAPPLELIATPDPPRNAAPAARPAVRQDIWNDGADTAEAHPKPAPPAPKISKGDVRSDAHEDLMLETKDIAQLRAVARTDAQRALALAQDGARKFPQGFFSQEREAIAIRSLVKLGRLSEARARAEHFLSAYPRAPAAESIRASVGLSPP